MPSVSNVSRAFFLHGMAFHKKALKMPLKCLKTDLVKCGKAYDGMLSNDCDILNR